MGNTAFHIVSAATNTSLAVFSIMLMILAKYPDFQKQVRNEVLEVSGGGGTGTYSRGHDHGWAALRGRKV